MKTYFLIIFVAAAILIPGLSSATLVDYNVTGNYYDFPPQGGKGDLIGPLSGTMTFEDEFVEIPRGDGGMVWPGRPPILSYSVQAFSFGGPTFNFTGSGSLYSDQQVSSENPWDFSELTWHLEGILNGENTGWSNPFTSWGFYNSDGSAHEHDHLAPVVLLVGPTHWFTPGDIFSYREPLFTMELQASQSNPVPEPATILLVCSGLLGLFGFTKKLRR